MSLGQEVALKLGFQSRVAVGLVDGRGHSQDRQQERKGTNEGCCSMLSENANSSVWPECWV